MCCKDVSKGKDFIQPKTNPKLNIFCDNGLMVLPSIPDPPIDLKELLPLTNVKDINFRSKIKACNSALAFTTSEEALKEDNSNRNGVYTHKMHGRLFHRFTSNLIFSENQQPRSSQIYIYDTPYQMDRKMQTVNTADRTVMGSLQAMIF
ncbi:Hypothetical predicted protein [Octopus vulgaris]|uniref:Uncharacterized protein n=1 Tax=Octopus vulgaris TaxID=6645 RepID=A0AA36BGI8_OCTVU|nr:Hypothetical predicted protein [Octopus vulgaris]